MTFENNVLYSLYANNVDAMIYITVLNKLLAVKFF